MVDVLLMDEDFFVDDLQGGCVVCLRLFDWIDCDVEICVILILVDNYYVVVQLINGDSEWILMWFVDVVSEMDIIEGFLIYWLYWVVKCYVVIGFCKGGKDYVELMMGLLLLVGLIYKWVLIGQGYVFEVRLQVL